VAGVSRRIGGSEVGLGLDDPRRQRTPAVPAYQDLAQQQARGSFGGLAERFDQAASFRTPRSRQARRHRRV
jgi:hypothetical protein